ncbi:MAG: hypothetical protein AB1637_00585 [Elusimicrobiota bacterium]
MKKYYVNLSFFVFLISCLNIFSQETSKYPPIKYVSQIKDLSSYFMYADGGFHADWYVGYNNCWIVKLPPIKKEDVEKAYIGAKLGRAKTEKDFLPIEGKIYIAVSDKPSFTSDSGYFLASGEDIPKEPLENESLPGVGQAKWFWASVPLSKINSDKDNYIAIWSQSDNFISSKTSPIIAAGYKESEGEDVWLNRSVKGIPPSGPGATETAIFGIKPAVAVKLIPKNEYKVIIKNFSAEIYDSEILINFSVIGADIQKAWIELSYDKFEWQKISGNIYSSPYFISLKKEDLPQDLFYLRVAAKDNYENIGYSKEIKIPPPQKNENQFSQNAGK